MKKINMKEKGITLIALVITIIVLLILAGVTIATLTGDNGILTKATEAKDKTEEGEEEEKVKLSVAGALAKDNGGEIKEGYLDEELASQFGEKGTDYNLEGSGPFTVTIIESGRSYIINEDGTTEEAVKREGIKVGDYVNYKPDENIEGYSAEKLIDSISGTDNNSETIEQVPLKWKILNIEPSGEVDLISETQISHLSLQKASGYNNGVLLLNDICRELYENKSLGIVGEKVRNLTIEDIEEQMNKTGKTVRNNYKNNSSGTQYGSTKTYNGQNKYPNLYALENGSGIDTEKVKDNGIGVSEEYYKEPTKEKSEITSTELTVTQTYYRMNFQREYLKKPEVYDMISNGCYWLASRYVDCNEDGAYFGLYYVWRYGTLLDYAMVISDGRESYEDRMNIGIRPVVSLGSDIQIIPVENADGSSPSNMHQISKQ